MTPDEVQTACELAADLGHAAGLRIWRHLLDDATTATKRTKAWKRSDDHYIKLRVLWWPDTKAVAVASRTWAHSPRPPGPLNLASVTANRVAGLIECADEHMWTPRGAN